MGHAARLTPTMRSRKLQALDVIKRYFAEWGHSPSLDEIAAAMGGISKQRASEYVHQLALEEMIRHTAGKRRGIALIDRGEELSEADVLVRLHQLGWIVAPAGRVVTPPALTENGLIALPYLDHE